MPPGANCAFAPGETEEITIRNNIIIRILSGLGDKNTGSEDRNGNSVEINKFNNAELIVLLFHSDFWAFRIFVIKIAKTTINSVQSASSCGGQSV